MQLSISVRGGISKAYVFVSLRIQLPKDHRALDHGGVLSERIKEHIRKAGLGETGYVVNVKDIWGHSCDDRRQRLVLRLLLLLVLRLVDRGCGVRAILGVVQQCLCTIKS